jgi:dTDP-4-dehydrorhamnose 3,5-epimerase
MKNQTFDIKGLRLLTPKIHQDDRGFFSETYNAQTLQTLEITDIFVQDNQSLSVSKGIIRGLHFQTPPHAKGKLVRVTRGAILDVAVDLRQGSPSFGKHVAVTLSAENWQQFWIPEGFAHGFCSLEPNTEILYKVTDYYAPECDKGLAWNDPALNIAWPVTSENAILSEKDAGNPPLSELPAYFRYDE